MITAKSISEGRLGRFANTAFTLAGTIGIAVKNGQPYGFGRWRTVDNAMFGDPVDDIEDHLVNELPRVIDVPYIDIPYHWDYREYNIPTGNYNIQSHLQDPRYFAHCMPLIRETMRFKDEPPQSDHVAIHYRAGDYIDDPDAYHPRQPSEYYRQAMAHFPPGTHFSIFSDDIEEATQRIPHRADCNHSYFSGDNYIQDFIYMKRCKSFIIANSSFSLMAAILGEHPDKKIVAPKLWFGRLANGLQFVGYPEGAVII